MKIPLTERNLPKGTITKLYKMLIVKLLANKAKKEALNTKNK